MTENETQPTALVLFPAADRLRRLREQKAGIEAALADIKKQIKDVEGELAEAMADAECRNFTRDGQMFILTTTEYWSAEPSRRDALYAALHEKGYEYLFKVNATDLGTFVRNAVSATEDENGETHLPGWLAGMVKCHEKPGISMRAAPKKSNKTKK